MQQRKRIGVRVDDFGADVKHGLRRAGELRFSAVEVSGSRENTSPESLSESGRRHLARLVSGAGLTFASLACDSRGGGLADYSRMDERVTEIARILQLAADMHVPIVSHDAGDLSNLSDAEQNRITEALSTIADRAERVGTVYAIRSGFAKPEAVRNIVHMIGCPFVKVGIDPAALLMAGFDPSDALTVYGEQIALAYVRDATRGSPERAGQETALGDGRLDLDAYLATLSASGCGSPPILRRVRADNPLSQIAADKAYLESRILI